MRVLVIPEDSRKDKFILKPLFESLFRSIGKSQARIRVCEDPVLGGVREALRSRSIAEVIRRQGGMMQIFILCVDRDGETGRRQRLREMEQEFGNDRVFLAENAWEELETWCSPAWICRQAGIGRPCEPKYRSRRPTSNRSWMSGTYRKHSVAVESLWQKRRHVGSI